MSIKGRISNVKSELTTAEAKIAEYVLANPEKVIQMTAIELAKEANSSSASVIRLAKRLDIGSFTTLKILLSADLTKEKEDPNQLDDIVAKDSLNSIKDKLLTSALQSLRETADQVTETELIPLVNRIKKAKQMLIFGSGASFLAAQNIAQKWNRIGIPSIADSDLNDLLPKLVNAGKDDIFWIISNSGESPASVWAADAARKAGVFVASLTRFGKNSVANMSDIAVHTSQPLESQNRIAATNSLLAQFMSIDLIFYYYVSQNFESSSKKLRASSSAVRSYKRLFVKKHPKTN